MQQTVFIGCGCGLRRRPTDAAGPVVETLARRDGPRFLIFETLAERTLALASSNGAAIRRAATTRRSAPARPGARPASPGIRIVGNFGAANPRAAAQRIARAGACSRLAGTGRGGRGRRSQRHTVAAELAARETGGTLLADGPAIISANVYLGAGPIAEALAAAPTSW